MELRTSPDAGSFLAETSAYRAADPVRTNVIGSVATGVAQGRRYDSETWYLVEHDGQVVGAAIWTEPYRLLVGPMEALAADALAAGIAASGRRPPGVVGPSEVAHRVAASAGWVTAPRMRERLLVLGEFVPAAGVPGAARVLGEDDVDLAADWMRRFAEDAGTFLPDPRESVLARLGSFRFWEVDGVPVSMAGHAPLVDSPGGAVARIGPVYTPAEHRRRGYAAAVTSAVVADVLGRASTVMLYTDAANPTSNGVYERLGFEVVAEVADLDVTGP